MDNDLPSKARDRIDPESAGAFGVILWNAWRDYERTTGEKLGYREIGEICGIDPSLMHTTIKGKGGRPRRPEAATAVRIIDKLLRFGFVFDPNEAAHAAGIVPEGMVLAPAEGNEWGLPKVWRNNPERYQRLLQQLEGYSPEAQAATLDMIIGVIEMQKKIHA